MSAKTMKVGYRIVRNGTSTADRAPYLGVAVPVGSLAYDNILQRMLDRGTFMTRATAQYFLNEFYEYAAERIAEDLVRINMGAVSLYPMIGGSFDSEDDTYREPRNRLYVGATLSQDVRDAVAGVAPVGLGAGPANGDVKISSVMDLASETYRLIDGFNEFRVVGIDLTVPDGEDESLALVAMDGLTKVADIAVVSTEAGQRIICRLASAVPAGTYYVRLVSHGLDPTAPLSTVLRKVAVKAGATPPAPAPTITGVCNDGGNDGELRLDGTTAEIRGTNLEDGADVTLYWDGHSEPFLTTEGTWNAESNCLQAQLTYEGSTETSMGQLKVTTDGGTASYNVMWLD